MHMVKIASYKLICFQMELWWRFRIVTALGPVVQMPVSARPGLNFNLGFFFFLSTALSWIIFYILFRVPNHQIVGKEKKTEFVFLSSNIWVQISRLPWDILTQLRTTQPWRHSEELPSMEYFTCYEDLGGWRMGYAFSSIFWLTSTDLQLCSFLSDKHCLLRGSLLLNLRTSILITDMVKTDRHTP